MYKTARAQSERDQDSDTEAPCDTQQLSVKIENNAMYGVLLYLQASVGGAITTSARNAIRRVAERTSADTDSLFLNVLSPTAYRSCTTLGVEMRNANDLNRDANKTNAENINVPRYDEHLTT